MLKLINILDNFPFKNIFRNGEISENPIELNIITIGHKRDELN